MCSCEDRCPACVCLTPRDPVLCVILLSPVNRAHVYVWSLMGTPSQPLSPSKQRLGLEMVRVAEDVCIMCMRTHPLSPSVCPVRVIPYVCC